MAPDGLPAPSSNAPTPTLSPFASGTSTPTLQENRKGALADYLTAPLSKAHFKSKAKTYLAGSKALDGLARLIASTESFFHPSNSGAWTSDVSTSLSVTDLLCFFEFWPQSNLNYVADMRS